MQLPPAMSGSTEGDRASDSLLASAHAPVTPNLEFRTRNTVSEGDQGETRGEVDSTPSGWKRELMPNEALSCFVKFIATVPPASSLQWHGLFCYQASSELAEKQLRRPPATSFLGVPGFTKSRANRKCLYQRPDLSKHNRSMFHS